MEECQVNSHTELHTCVFCFQITGQKPRSRRWPAYIFVGNNSCRLCVYFTTMPLFPASSINVADQTEFNEQLSTKILFHGPFWLTTKKIWGKCHLDTQTLCYILPSVTCSFLLIWLLIKCVVADVCISRTVWFFFLMCLTHVTPLMLANAIDAFLLTTYILF